MRRTEELEKSQKTDGSSPDLDFLSSFLMIQELFY